MYIASDEATDTFLVEVSGWDSSNKFLVEHAVLSWNGEEGKEIALRNAVRASDMVFVRLLQPVDRSENLPVACHVIRVSDRDMDGRILVRVAESRPRAPFRENADTLAAAGVTTSVSLPSSGASQVVNETCDRGDAIHRIPL